MLKRTTQLYGLAAALAIGIVPFTIIFMSSTNNKLFGEAAQRGKGISAYDDGFAVLIERWKTLNFVRSLLPLLGGIVSLVATFG